MRPLPFKFITFIYYGYITLVYFSMFLRAICKFFTLHTCRTCSCYRSFLVCKFFEELETNILTWKSPLFSRHRDSQALFFLTQGQFSSRCVTCIHYISSPGWKQHQRTKERDDMRVNFSSAWKANIFTHTGIANRVLREEISGLKKKKKKHTVSKTTFQCLSTYLVMLNLNLIVCSSMISPTPTSEPERIY